MFLTDPSRRTRMGGQGSRHPTIGAVDGVLPNPRLKARSMVRPRPRGLRSPRLGVPLLDGEIGAVRPFGASHSEPHTRALARRLAQGPDPEANRPLKPQAEIMTSGKERVVKKRQAGGFTDVAAKRGSLAHG